MSIITLIIKCVINQTNYIRKTVTTEIIKCIRYLNLFILAIFINLMILVAAVSQRDTSSIHSLGAEVAAAGTKKFTPLLIELNPTN